MKVVAGPPARSGMAVECSGNWRNEEERLFEFKILSSCSTATPLDIRLYDESDNLLNDACPPPPPNPSGILLIAGREEPVTLCRKLPRRSMLVKFEVQAPCKGEKDQKAASERGQCEVR
jgi:hypothetical protein